MSLSGRGISNIVNRNIIGGISNFVKGNFIRDIWWNDFGNKKVMGSSVGVNKNMFIGSEVSRASSTGAGMSAGARALVSASSELTSALVVEPALWMETLSAGKGRTG